MRLIFAYLSYKIKLVARKRILPLGSRLLRPKILQGPTSQFSIKGKMKRAVALVIFFSFADEIRYLILHPSKEIMIVAL